MFIVSTNKFSKILSCLLFATLQNSKFVQNADGLRLRANSALILCAFLK